MPTKKKPQKPEPDAEPTPGSPDNPVGAINFQAKRRHIPPAGLEAEGRIAESPTVRYEYNPHLPPVLRFSDDPVGTDALPELLRDAKQRPLSDTEVRMLADALRRHEPVSTQAILKVLAKEPVQRSLFADPERNKSCAGSLGLWEYFLSSLPLGLKGNDFMFCMNTDRWT